MVTSLITGATSGLGAEFARQLAAEKHDLVLVARDESRLATVAAELRDAHGVEVETIAADLSETEGVEKVEERLQDTERPIDLLINNAGFGQQGKFLDNAVEKHDTMVRVNALAVLRLTHAALGTMVARGSGGVINMGSVAAYTPGIRPSSTYAATKAFVVALSEGLAPALHGTGVKVSALCPGWVRTEFHMRAGINMSKLPRFFWLDAPGVVSTGLADHRAGKVISVPGTQYKVIVVLARMTPRWIVHAVSRWVGRKAH